VSWYFQTHSCGVVASEDSVSSVKKALISIIENEDLRLNISKNAKRQAVADFSADVASEKFLSLLE
jgi:glycosyltransferase involved in cell wall biosynthesis